MKMINETITISAKTKTLLYDLMAPDDTLDDVIMNLIIYFNNEEFSSQQAEFYNSEIEKCDNGFYNDLKPISINQLKKEVTYYELKNVL